MSAERGVLLQLYTRELNHQSAICALGKLDNGETFAIHDDRLHARFFIRLEDANAHVISPVRRSTWSRPQ